MSKQCRVYSDVLCESMGVAYDQAIQETPHASLFPEMRRAIAEHILRDADHGLSRAAQLCSSAGAAFTTEAV